MRRRGDKEQMFLMTDHVTVADSVSPFVGWHGRVVECLPDYFYAGPATITGWRYRVEMYENGNLPLTFSESQLKRKE